MFFSFFCLYIQNFSGFKTQLKKTLKNVIHFNKYWLYLQYVHMTQYQLCNHYCIISIEYVVFTVWIRPYV